MTGFVIPLEEKGAVKTSRISTFIKYLKVVKSEEHQIETHLPPDFYSVKDVDGADLLLQI